MNLTDDLHCHADPDTIVVWWEKPDEAGQIKEYEMRLDGSLAGVTQKTHFTFDNLENGREYTVQVSVKNGEGLLLDDVSCRILTPARRDCIVVTDAPYLAVGDSVTKNTGAIQRAIDDCQEGGTVVIPKGTFLTGALRLHSDMELYIAEGAVLLGSTDPSDYLPMMPSRAEGLERECYAGLLNIGALDHTEGPVCHDVVLRGKGTLKGGGEVLSRREAEAGAGSAALVEISNCSDVRISSLTLMDAPQCGVHITYSLNAAVDHCTFRSGEVKISDGLTVDSSENCSVFACSFFTGGSAVSVESGKGRQGREIDRPARKIRISDCRSMFGSGICVGPEIGGGVENVRIWDCDLERSSCGIQITGNKNGGGYVRGILVQDCITPRLRAFPAGSGDDKDGAGTPDFENYLYERIEITGRSLKNGEWRDCRTVEMDGFDKEHPVRNVLLKNVDIRGGLGVYTGFCKNLRFEGDDI